MTSTRTTRRAFLSTLGAAAASLPLAATLTACLGDERSLTTLTRGERRTLRAFAAQILPAVDGHAGADELGVLDFVDAVLARPPYVDELPIVRAGLSELDARATTIGARAGFASLRKEHQVHIMRDLEKTDFFDVARTLVIAGAFADPSHGGNRNGEGWSLIGMEHRATYGAPYGWYDARVAASAGAA